MVEEVLRGEDGPPSSTLQEPGITVAAAPAVDDAERDCCRLGRIMDVQRELIHEQIKELQRVVVLQCRMTGTNPLAQEMAAAVLGKRSGKKFGEPLTPKALKYLYNVFSIKDTITKKEARELSALCGATVTQVREFFSGQRSRVRRFMQLSHDDAGCSSKVAGAHCLISNPSECFQEQQNESLPSQAQDIERPYLSFLNCFREKADGATKKSTAVETAENLLSIMRKENTFSGQSEIAQIISQQEHGPVLRWFMVKGGLQQITKWLVQAAAEEQTSLIRLILKIIAQLPIGSALPMQMSSLLQTVNRLRFYRVQDVASRARLLLSRWSRFLRGSYNGRALPPTGTTGPLQKRSREVIVMQNDGGAIKKKSKIDNVVDLQRCLTDAVPSTSAPIKLSHVQTELLEAPTETTTIRKRPGCSLFEGNRTKERRKVQLFEEARAAGRRKEVETLKPTGSDAATRPLSADDIKKAKRRAYLLQSLSQKPSDVRLDSQLCMPLRSQEGVVCSPLKGPSGNEKGPTALEVSKFGPARHGKVKTEGIQHDAGQDVLKRLDMSDKGVHFKKEATNRKRGVTASDNMGFNIIPWALPPKIALDSRWTVSSGHESLESALQSMRIKNEQEVLYTSLECIPSNPLEPLERGSLFVDDSLVPEILLETVEDDSQEKDCSLPSPKDLSAEKRRAHEEADCKVFDKLSRPSHTEEPSVVIKPYMVGPSKPHLMEHGVKLTSVIDSVSARHQAEVMPLLPVPAMNSEDQFGEAYRLKSTTNDVTPAVVEEHHSLGVGDKVSKDGSVNTKELEHGTNLFDKLNMVRKGVHKSSGQKVQAIGSSSSPLKACVSVPSTNAFTSGVLCPNIAPVCSLISQRGSQMVTKATPDLLKPVIGAEVPADSQLPITEPGPDAFGVKLSELSKEACLDMLKVVLQQLADSSGDSGADLELLSVFLKNPDLVAALTSSQAVELTNSMQTFAANSNSISSINNVFVNSQAEKLVGKNVLTSAECQNTQNDPRSKAMAGLGASAPPPQLGHMLPLSTRSFQSMPPPSPRLPPFPHPVPAALLDQAIMEQKQTHQINDQTHGHAQASNSAGLDARASLDITVQSVRSGSNEGSGLCEYPQGHHGFASGTPTRPFSQSAANRPSLPVNVVGPQAREADVRGQGSLLHGDFCAGKSDLGKLDNHTRGQNGFIFSTSSNTHLEQDGHNIEGRSSAGILHAPGPGFMEERFQHCNVPVSMPDASGAGPVGGYVRQPPLALAPQRPRSPFPPLQQPLHLPPQGPFVRVPLQPRFVLPTQQAIPLIHQPRLNLPLQPSRVQQQPRLNLPLQPSRVQHQPPLNLRPQMSQTPLVQHQPRLNLPHQPFPAHSNHQSYPRPSWREH